jgi:hypothetical protein
VSRNTPPQDALGRELHGLLWTRIREGDDDAIKKRKDALFALAERLNWREAEALWKRLEKGGDLHEDFTTRITASTQEAFKARLTAVGLVAAVVPQAYFRGIGGDGAAVAPQATAAKATAQRGTGYKYDDRDPTTLHDLKNKAFAEYGYDSPEYKEAAAAYGEWDRRLDDADELKKFMQGAADRIDAELGADVTDVHVEGNTIKGTVHWTEHKEIMSAFSHGERWKLRDEYIPHSKEVTIAHFHDWSDLTFAPGECNNGTAVSEGLGPLEYVIDAVTLAGILKGLGKMALKRLAARSAVRTVFDETESATARALTRRLSGEAVEEGEVLAQREAAAALKKEGDDAVRAAPKPKPPKPPKPKAPQGEKKFFSSDGVPYSVQGPHGSLSGTSVYVLKDAGGTVLYVGKGTTFDRLRAHIKDVKKTDWFGEIDEIRVPATGLTNSEALALEQDLIAQLKPLYNKDLHPFDKEFRGAMDMADNLPRAQAPLDFKVTWEAP